MATFGHPSPSHQRVLPGQWTDAADDTLRAVMRDCQGKSWADIARYAFPTGEHDKSDCLERWRILSRPRSIKGPWSAEEDKMLVKLVAELGAEKWVLIAGRLQTRTGKQCRERWHNHLDPSVNKAPFTPEEDALICAMYKQIGSKWAEMAKMMPGRPDNAIKNHFNTSLQRSKRRNAAAAAASASAVATSGQTRSPLRSPPNSIITDRRYSPYGPPSSSSKPPSPSALSSASSTSSHTRKPMAPPSVARDLNKEYFNSVFAGNGWTPPTPDESPNGRMVGMSVPGSDGVGDFPFGCYVSQAQHYSLPNLKAVLAHVDQGGHTTMPGNVPSHSHFSLQNLDARGNLPPSPGSPPVNPLPKQYSAAPTSQAGPLPPLRSFSGSSVSAGMIPRMPQMPMHSTYSYPVMRRDVYPESGIVDDRLEMDMAGVALVQRG